MKKFFNHTDSLLREALTGLVQAHDGLLRAEFEPTFVARKQTRPGKVALISGGGSGHEPLHAGFVGEGMLDAACPGQVFTSPTPDQMLAAAQAVDGGRGVLFIVKNYSGDRMNFELAAEMLELESDTVLVNDDVAVENSTYTTGRRGVAGTLIVEKAVGAAAEQGATLAQCKALGEWAWPSPVAPCPPPGGRPSTSDPTTSKWAWASMANPGVAARSSSPPTPSSRI